jgi:Xaa-Pro aminopeptidase
MMHYSATPEKYSMIEPKGFLLVDSGGHYIDGTTDVTRTITVGELSEEEKVDYTTVLRCHLRLMEAHFPKGATGQNLDILARGPVWDRGLDYRCGTGHGVGHILNVHEGPNNFRWRIQSKANAWPLMPGMITSNEPGLYIEDGYGIRIENEVLVVEDVKTEYGQFYKLKNLTVAPIDLEPVIVDMLTQYEREAINNYHKFVYETLSPYFEGEELEWLKHETREI